ncbi:hypothetical protein [Sporomusa sphaeroides]|nr:hypothetical protein [Sporomusa sphaeroides]
METTQKNREFRGFFVVALFIQEEKEIFKRIGVRYGLRDAVCK